MKLMYRVRGCLYLNLWKRVVLEEFERLWDNAFLSLHLCRSWNKTCLWEAFAMHMPPRYLVAASDASNGSGSLCSLGLFGFCCLSQHHQDFLYDFANVSISSTYFWSKWSWEHVFESFSNVLPVDMSVHIQSSPVSFTHKMNFPQFFVLINSSWTSDLIVF